MEWNAKGVQRSSHRVIHSRLREHDALVLRFGEDDLVASSLVLSRNRFNLRSLHEFASRRWFERYGCMSVRVRVENEDRLNEKWNVQPRTRGTLFEFVRRSRCAQLHTSHESCSMVRRAERREGKRRGGEQRNVGFRKQQREERNNVEEGCRRVEQGRKREK